MVLLETKSAGDKRFIKEPTVVLCSLWGNSKCVSISLKREDCCWGYIFNLLTFYSSRILELAFEYMDKSAFKMKVGYISDVKYFPAFRVQIMPPQQTSLFRI